MWGHAPPEKVWNLEALRLLLRLLLGQYDASRRPDDRVSDVCPLRRTTWFCLSDCSLTSQATAFADEAWKNEKLLEDSDELFRTVHGHLASFSTLVVHLGAMRGRLQSNGAIWQCQASHGDGKSGPIETGLTGLAATALCEVG